MMFIIMLHIFVGSSGGNTEDMKQAIQLIESKTVDASKIVTHVFRT